MINIENFRDNQCFKYCLIRYLNPTDHKQARSRKMERMFERKFNFKGIKFLIKIRDINKIEKNNFISINVIGYENN